MQVSPVRLKKTVTIEATPAQVYAFWADLENFQSFIPMLDSIERLDEVNSRWVIRAPLGHEVRFDSTIVEQSPPGRVVWETHHSAGNARGELTFTGNGPRTQVDLDFRYSLHSTWIQQLARLVNRLGFPSRAFDIGLALIKRQIERQTG